MPDHQMLELLFAGLEAGEEVQQVELDLSQPEEIAEVQRLMQQLVAQASSEELEQQDEDGSSSGVAAVQQAEQQEAGSISSSSISSGEEVAPEGTDAAEMAKAVELAELQEVVVSLARLAQWRYVPPAPAWLQRCCDMLTAGLPAVPPDGLARCLLYLANIHHPLPRQQLQLMLAQLYRCFGRLDGRSLAIAAYAAAQYSEVYEPPSEWTNSLMSAAVRRVRDLDVEAVAMLLRAVAVLEPVGAHGLARAVEGQAMWGLGAASGSECASLLHGYALLQYQPQPLLGQHLLNCLQGNLSDLGAADVAGVLGDLALLSWQPPPMWLERALDHVMSLLPECDVTDLVRVVEALSLMGYQADDSRVQAVVARFQVLLADADPASLDAEAYRGVRQSLGLLR